VCFEQYSVGRNMFRNFNFFFNGYLFFFHPWLCHRAYVFELASLSLYGRRIVVASRFRVELEGRESFLFYFVLFVCFFIKITGERRSVDACKIHLFEDWS